MAARIDKKHFAIETDEHGKVKVARKQVWRDVSQKLREKNSKKVRPQRRGAP